MSLEDKIWSAAKSVAKYVIGADIHPYFVKSREYTSALYKNSDRKEKFLGAVSRAMSYVAEPMRYVHRFACLVNEGALVYTSVKHPGFAPFLVITEIFLRGYDLKNYRDARYNEENMEVMAEAKKFSEITNEELYKFRDNVNEVHKLLDSNAEALTDFRSSILQLKKRQDSSLRRYQRLADYITSRDELMREREKSADKEIIQPEIRRFVEHLGCIRNNIPNTNLMNSEKIRLSSETFATELYWMRSLAGITQTR